MDLKNLISRVETRRFAARFDLRKTRRRKRLLLHRGE